MSDIKTALTRIEDSFDLGGGKKYTGWKEDIRYVRQQLESLGTENIALTEHLHDCVQERIDELNAEGDAFNKECWVYLRKLCEDSGLDWQEFPDGITADNAYEFMREVLNAKEAEIEHLRKQVIERDQVIEQRHAMLKRKSECITILSSALKSCADYFEGHIDVNWEGTGPNQETSLFNEVEQALQHKEIIE